MLFEITSEDIINWNVKTETEKKINQIANILKIRKGEIPFLRDVGISDNYVDRPTTLIKPAIINDITALIYDYVYGVTLQSVDIGNSDITGDIIVKVVCEIE